MKRGFLMSRRRLLVAAASVLGADALSSVAGPALADEKPPSDRGIGGTGITSAPGEGSIGFIGSIQRFGSIFVNGSRITYPADAKVVIDGRIGGPDDFIIGQVVKTVAHVAGDRLETDHVEVLSEVVGPVASREGSIMVVLGQMVDCGTTGPDAFAIGERVAVSGIRRVDGTIVARLIQPAAWRADQVVGPAWFEGWTLRIGDLQLLGPDQRYEGRRVVVRGNMIATGLQVASIALDLPPSGAGVTSLSIEAFAARHGDEMQLGSGFVFSDTQPAATLHHENGPSYIDVRLADPGTGPQQNWAGGSGGPNGAYGMHHGVTGMSVDPSVAGNAIGAAAPGIPGMAVGVPGTLGAGPGGNYGPSSPRSWNGGPQGPNGQGG